MSKRKKVEIVEESDEESEYSASESGEEEKKSDNLEGPLEPISDVNWAQACKLLQSMNQEDDDSIINKLRQVPCNHYYQLMFLNNSRLQNIHSQYQNLLKYCQSDTLPSSPHTNKPTKRKAATEASSPNKHARQSHSSQQPSLDSALTSIQTSLTTNPSTLQQTHSDWSDLKSKLHLSDKDNEGGIMNADGIDLKKARLDGYLEKKEFLSRVDLREFEVERQLRTSTRSKHK